MKRNKLPNQLVSFAILSALLLLGACSGGGGSSDGRAGDEDADFGCGGDCANQNLTVADVELILRQGVTAAQQLGVAATIAVLDRTSNVLALYQMPGAQTTSVVTSGTAAQGGLEGAVVPAAFCAISKAGTASNFSSQGNAFGSRTANQLLQEHFNPGEDFQPSGPLFGVQFSQGLCSDINVINPDFGGSFDPTGKTVASGLIGPRSQPIGFAADAGGIPVYKLGDMVGSIGVELDGIYTLDRDLTDRENSLEERIALSAATNFEVPADRQASRIFVRGKSLRLTDIDRDDLEPLPDPLPALDPSGLLSIPFFTGGAIRAGSTLGTPESGYIRVQRAGIEVEVVVDGTGAVRFPSINGSPLPGGAEIKANEVEAILDASMITARKTRTQVRRPLDDYARLAVWITDTEGNVVGFVRSKDTILDSTDVTLQKARAAAFFSSPDAADKLIQAGFGEYVTRSREFLGPDAFTGTIAWSTTALGNIGRPLFPDGVSNNGPGPLNRPEPGFGGASTNTYSIFNLGLQSDVYIGGFLAGVSGQILDGCTNTAVFGKRIKNGITFFAGGFPLYRGNTLIGAISSSGDGTEQDDLIPFFAASRPGLDSAGATGVGDPVLGFNAPFEIRADQIAPPGFPQTNLRYVICPEGPFIGSNEQNVCEGL